MLNSQQIQKNIEAVQTAIDSMIDLIDKGILKDSLRPTLNLLRDKEAEFKNDLEQITPLGKLNTYNHAKR